MDISHVFLLLLQTAGKIKKERKKLLELKKEAIQ